MKQYVRFIVDWSRYVLNPYWKIVVHLRHQIISRVDVLKFWTRPLSNLFHRASSLNPVFSYTGGRCHHLGLATCISGGSVQCRRLSIVMGEEIPEAWHGSGARVKALAVSGVRLCARLKTSQHLSNGSLCADLPKSSPARTY